MSKVRVEYFALFRDERGQDAEELTTSFKTVGELYQDLKTLHSFSLPENRVKVAINDSFCTWQQSLNDGDRVVFIPPVAGG